ncbi:MAG: hypothetical protein ACFFAO_18535 [Candidatus Hermodarchaeota archaeon]
MKEIDGQCPVCNQNRTLRSIKYWDDRIHGLTISKNPKFIDYLCYKCRNKIEIGIKKGKQFTTLNGNGFNVLGYGPHKYLDTINKELKISKVIIKTSSDFIDNIYSKWFKIQSEQKFKYYFASLIMLLKNKNEEDKIIKLLSFIENHFGISNMEIEIKLNELILWCKSKNFDPF